MTGYGKMKRLYHIMCKDAWRTVVIQMDDGIALGQIKGLENVREAIKKLPEWGATSIIMPKGMVGTTYSGVGEELGLIVNLSADVRLGDRKTELLVGTVEEAIRLGADAVCVQVRLGTENETQMVQNLAQVAESCDLWGIPLLAMVYPTTNEYDAKPLKNAVRLASDLGANIVVTNYTGDTKSFKDVLRACPKPVAISHGPKMKSIKELIQMVKEAVESGAIGFVIGQKILANRNPKTFIEAVRKVVSQ